MEDGIPVSSLPSSFLLPPSFLSRLLFLVLCLLSSVLYPFFGDVRAQNDDLELLLDVSQHTVPLPKVFKPGIDLSGRGLHNDITWPQTVAAPEALAAWQREIGFNGIFRIQYNLWEISQLYKAKDLQKKLLANYEQIIKQVSDAGGAVILNIYGTPEGLGQLLDKKSPAEDFKTFKTLIKDVIRELSCVKRYSVWYEFWNSPDLDEFYLGRKQEYLNLYRAVAESVIELRRETKVHIPLGGPSISWWFQNLSGNTNATPEKSFIYELIKFCYRYRLPLDFISWHSYSTDPGAEKETTVYAGKNAVTLVREWLSYFGFDKNTPLIIDEWNFDRDANILPERKEKSFIAASCIPSRLKNMYQAGIDYQLYFCLEDFQNNKEGVVRNVGIFYFDPDSAVYAGGPKTIFNVYRMLARLGREMWQVKFDDEFVGAIATRDPETIKVLLYNYIDPDITTNYLARNLATLNPSERKTMLRMLKNGIVEKIMVLKQDIGAVHATKKIKGLLKKAQEINDRAKKFEFSPRSVALSMKNLKGHYHYQRYTVDSSCSFMCEFTPAAEKDIIVQESGYEEKIVLNPYSVHLVVFEKRGEMAPPAQQPAVLPEAAPEAAAKESLSAETMNSTSIDANPQEK